MKTKSILFMIGALVCTAVFVHAQTPDESQIKLLRTEKPGVIRMIHAITTDEPVCVKFINDDGVVGIDNIRGKYPKGVTRRYNLNRIYNKNFRVEISSEDLKVIYKIVPSADRKDFTAYLERVERNYEPLVASR